MKIINSACVFVKDLELGKKYTYLKDEVKKIYSFATALFSNFYKMTSNLLRCFFSSLKQNSIVTILFITGIILSNKNNSKVFVLSAFMGILIELFLVSDQEEEKYDGLMKYISNFLNSDKFKNRSSEEKFYFFLFFVSIFALTFIKSFAIQSIFWGILMGGEIVSYIQKNYIKKES